MPELGEGFIDACLEAYVVRCPPFHTVIISRICIG